MPLLPGLRRRILYKLLRLPAGGDPARILELQRFAGYAEEDLAVLDQFLVTPTPQPTPGFVTDPFGVRTRVEMLPAFASQYSGQVLGLPVPDDRVHAEIVEYLGLYRSVAAAGASFTAMELGAGWGPWLVAGAVAARQRGIEEVRLYGVEGDAEHHAFMRQHFADNGLDPDDHVLLHAAVGAEPGRAHWPASAASPREAWGMRPVRDGSDADRSYVAALDGTSGTAQIDVVPVTDLLRREPHWDLVHIDIQGWEGEVCHAGIDDLTARARFVVVGTHSRELDGRVLRTFWEAGWELLHEKPARFTYRADAPQVENMTVVDGTQVWYNPRR